jgi:predicted DsbA family dithiol-disulfide isomerase
VRLRRVEEEFGAGVHVERRSFLLRPRPGPARTLGEFRDYTRTWPRAAADPDGGTFQVWRTHAGPPSHSVPPHLVAKAAAALGDAAYRNIDERLFHAYFAENRDITDDVTLQAIWWEAGLPEEAFALSADTALLRTVMAEHAAAIEAGVSGVPAVQVAGEDPIIVGAQSLGFYRRWVSRALASARS